MIYMFERPKRNYLLSLKRNNGIQNEQMFWVFLRMLQLQNQNDG